jgi:iron complex outermembrane receptor protein
MKRGILLIIFISISSVILAQRQLDSVLINDSYPKGKKDLSIDIIYPATQDQQAGKEIPYLLEMMPGIVSYSDNGTGLGSTSFRIRGTDPSRTNITIDGIPVNDAESQTVFWINIPDIGAMAKRITVQRGAGSSAFGTAAFGGAVDINTGEPSEKAHAGFTGTYGSFNAQNIGVSLGTGKLQHNLSFDGQYYYLTSDGYLDRSDSRQQSARIGAYWEGKSHRLKATLLYGEQHSKLTFDGVAYDSLKTNRKYNLSGLYYDDNGNIQFYENETDNYQQTHAHLHYVQKIGNFWELNSALYYTKGLGYYEQYKDDASLSKYGIPDQTVNGTIYRKSDLIRRKSLDNDFFGINIAGLYSNQRWDINISAGVSRYIGGHTGKIVWLQRNAGEIEYNRDWYNNTGTKNEANLFAKANYAINKELSVFAELQYRHIKFKLHGFDDDYYEYPDGFLNNVYIWNFVNPQVGIVFRPSSAHQTYASFAMLNREPNRSDLKNVEKNGIKKETLYDVEAGYRFRGEFASLGINLYYMHYKDQIVATGRLNDSYRPIMENAPKSYRMGIELSGILRFNRIELEGNLNFSRNKLKNYTNYIDLNDWSGQYAEFFSSVDISYSPSMTGAFILTFEPVSNLRLALTAKYVGKQYYDNTGSDDRMLDAYFPFNFNADYNFSISNINCFAQIVVNNIFNIDYSSSAYLYYRTVDAGGVTDEQDRRFFPQAGTNFAVKVGIRF